MNHRIFERTLHPLAFRGVRLFECREFLHSTALPRVGLGLWGSFAGPNFQGPLPLNALVRFGSRTRRDKSIYVAAGALSFLRKGGTLLPTVFGQTRRASRRGERFELDLKSGGTTR